ncbi:MAG: hypothetical protein HYU69_05935 [Bacteroidetes bacterium]|nr:hypothetical protein [Bacteroidota bacterium]
MLTYSAILFSLILNYPLWFVIFCLLTGAGYSLILYYRDHKLNEFPQWLIYLISGLRFLVVSIVSFLLLSPLLRSTTKTSEKPVIIIAQDNSESIVHNKDSAFYRLEYQEKLNDLANDLSEKYEVKIYSFGDKITTDRTFTYKEKQTDISSLFDELETRYSGRNVGAIVIASDGLYNKGYNPEYTSFSLKAPVYTIAMGDTTIRKDAAIAKVAHNRFAYLGNKFPVQIVISAHRLKGLTTELTVSKKDEKLFSQQIFISNNSFNSTVTLILDAKESGIQRYHIKLTALPGESSTANNEQDFFIDVRDGREKILLVANAPHPDIAAIKDAIENNQNYEVETSLADNFNQPVKKYSLVILHQVNAVSKIITDIRNSEVPVWYIGTPPPTLSLGVNMNGMSNKINEVEAVMTTSFPLFTVSDELRNLIKNMPAVQSPFGNYRTGTSANVLLYQKIGIIETQTPLMIFDPNGDRKTALFIGDGLWKWRMRDYAENGSHKLFNELITKTIQYLSTKVDKSFFRIFQKNNFYENDAIEFDAEVYNASYELINEPDVEINIINSDNKKFPFVFSKTANAYHLNAGMLPVGQYRYEAKVKVGDKQYRQNGEFSVTAQQVETVNTIADHHLLFNMAKKHGGEMIYPNELGKLNTILQQREDIKTVVYSEKKLTDLINLKWLFFALFAILSLEWFIRKQNGAY